MKKPKKTFFRTTSKKPVKVEKTLLTTYDLENALFETERYFEQAMCKFFLMGETLRSIKIDNEVKGKFIDLGVEDKSPTKEVKSFLQGWGFELGDGTMRLMVKDVPVRIRIIYKHYPWLENQDFCWYKVTQLNTPNPWREGL